MKSIPLFLIATVLALNSFASKADAQIVVRTRGVHIGIGRGVGFGSAPFAGHAGFNHGVGVGFRQRFFTPRLGLGLGVGYGAGYNYAAQTAAFQYQQQQQLSAPFVQQSYQSSYSSYAAPFQQQSFAAPLPTAPCGQPTQTFAPRLAAPQGGGCASGGCLPAVNAMLSRFGY